MKSHKFLNETFGWQYMAIENPDGTYTVANVGGYQSISIAMIQDIDVYLHNAKKIYNMFGDGKDDSEKIVDLEELKKMSKESDGVIMVLPDKFIYLKEYLKYKNGDDYRIISGSFGKKDDIFRHMKLPFSNDDIKVILEKDNDNIEIIYHFMSPEQKDKYKHLYIAQKDFDILSEKKINKMKNVKDFNEFVNEEFLGSWGIGALMLFLIYLFKEEREKYLIKKFIKNLDKNKLNVKDEWNIITIDLGDNWELRLYKTTKELVIVKLPEREWFGGLRKLQKSLNQKEYDELLDIIEKNKD